MGRVDVMKPNKTKLQIQNSEFTGFFLSASTRNQNLHKVQKNLTRSEKLLSKVIHNHALYKLSEGFSKVLARPFGLLIGSVIAFGMSLGTLILCRYFGYEYNYSVGLGGLATGYVVGLLGELSYKSVFRKR